MFILKKMNDRRGDTDNYVDMICLDYRNEFISTMVHEVLHYIHPKWKEPRVLKQEKKLMNTFSVLQVQRILKLYALFQVASSCPGCPTTKTPDMP